MQRPPVPGFKTLVNYGLNQMRFVSPVRLGSRIRVVMTLIAVEEKRSGQFQQTHQIVIENEEHDRPSVTAIWLT